MEQHAILQYIYRDTASAEEGKEVERGNEMKKLDHPERLKKNAIEAHSWPRLHRQVFYLSDGRHSMIRIAHLLHKHRNNIQKIVLDLLFGGQIRIWQMQERKGLTVNVELLKQSFEMVKPISAPFAHHFYTELFKQYPQTRSLFPEGEEGMKRQEKSLVAALAIIIGNVTTGSDLTSYLSSLGNRHVQYGAKPEHFLLVGALLIQTFKDLLGQQFTPAMQDAWNEAYSIISEAMLA